MFSRQGFFGLALLLAADFSLRALQSVAPKFELAKFLCKRFEASVEHSFIRDMHEHVAAYLVKGFDAVGVSEAGTEQFESVPDGKMHIFKSIEDVGAGDETIGVVLVIQCCNPPFSRQVVDFLLCQSNFVKFLL